MSEINLIEMLSERERQQRLVAARVVRPDAVEFHRSLAEHYAQLLVEVRGFKLDRGSSS
jgi:hypothetical protein